VAKTRRTTFDKLQRERARQAKQAEKRDRRQTRRDANKPVTIITPPVPSGDAVPSATGSDDEAVDEERIPPSED
jgi:hypothetical protein